MINLNKMENVEKIHNECKERVINYLESFNFSMEDATNSYQKMVFYNSEKDILSRAKLEKRNLKPITQKLRFGDTKLKYRDYNNFNIDIRYGTFISKKSLEQFKGDYYILVPKGDMSEEGIKNAMVIKKSTIKSYFQPIQEDRMIKLSNGTLGYRFNRIKNFIRLEDFVLELTKILLSQDINRGLEDLKLKFNKVKGTRVPYKTQAWKY